MASDGPRLTEVTLHSLPREPGTYALALRLDEIHHLVIGALGPWTFPAGCYLYVGSAWGPGGLRARLSRHLRGDGRPHWHIDVLRRVGTPAALWLAPQEHLECIWARYLAAQPEVTIPVPRFGASDCHCPSHLFLLTHEAEALRLPQQPAFLPLRRGTSAPTPALDDARAPFSCH